MRIKVEVLSVGRSIDNRGPKTGMRANIPNLLVSSPRIDDSGAEE